MNILLHIFFILLFLASSQSLDRLLTRADAFNDNYPRQLNVIIKHCGEEYVYKRLRIISVSRESGVEFYRNINEEKLIPIEVYDDLNGLNSVGWQSCVLLLLSMKNIQSFLNSVDKYSWVPSNIYVIQISDKSLINGPKKTSYEHMWFLSAVELWEKKRVHKFVLSINGRNLFFDPFERVKSFENTENSILNRSELPKNSFGVPRDLENAELLRTRDTFGGYEVNVALFSYVAVKRENETWSGLDANAMNEICKRMNVTPQIFEPPEKFGWLSNGKFTGALGRLVYHKSDLVLNGFFIKDYGAKELEFSSYVDSDKICVIVPRRNRVPEYLLIVRIFSLYGWALILVANNFVAVTYVAMTSLNFRLFKNPNTRKARGGLKFKKSLKNSPPNFKREKTLTRVQRFLAMSIFFSLHPIKANSKRLGERLHVAFGLMLGIVIGGCFTSQLASSFSRPAFLKNINTLSELDDSGFEVVTSFPNLLDDVFADNESSTFRNLQLKLELKNASEIESRVSQKENVGYLDRKHIVILAGNSSDELHVISDYPKEYYLAYPIARGSPFLSRMNTVIGRLQNGGFYKKWFNDVKKPWKNEDNRKPVVIRLPHLYIPFLILFTGLGISGFIFYYELNNPRIKKVKNFKGKY